MNAPRSFEAPQAGRYVLFADVEDALRDRARLEWLLPIVDGSDDGLANRRTAALLHGLLLQLSGVPLVDHAMRNCP